MPQNIINAEVAVVGAGLIGSSVAMHLSALGCTDVAVLDLDLEGAFSSSELNAGGVRATWNHPANSAISRLSIEYYEKIASQIGFRQNGYFWMYSKDAWPNARKQLESNPTLKSLNVEYLNPSEIRNRYPFIDKTADLGGATFSPRDGLLNPNLLKLHYREKAKEKGVRFYDGVWIDKAHLSEKQIELDALSFEPPVSQDDLKAILTGEKSSKTGTKISVRTRVLVNCVGAWARRFAKQVLDQECPSFPLRRQVSIFNCKDVDLTPYGMFVDPSGVYFHAEASNILGGFADPNEQHGYNLEYDGHAFFENSIWPPLYERSTHFESLKHITGWGGLYEVSPDKSGIIGPVDGLKNVFEAHSFSGRGAMQSYATGLGLAELILKGRYHTLDLSVFSGDRFRKGETVSEGLLI